MKSKDEIIEYCLRLPGAYLDYPFDDKTPVLRHSGNKKMFALFTCSKGGPLLFNLKCEPMKADFWRSVYEDVSPAYHMNKTHWNSIAVGGCVDISDFTQMIEDSFKLTAPRRKS